VSDQFRVPFSCHNKYYGKSDQNPAHIMAVFLNPHYRQHWFKYHWHSDFVKFAMDTIEEEYKAALRIYNADAPTRSSISPPRKELPTINSAPFNNLRTNYHVIRLLLSHQTVKTPYNGGFFIKISTLY
jgi:hypothetical protein